jgi:hypothetical protein
MEALKKNEATVLYLHPVPYSFEPMISHDYSFEPIIISLNIFKIFHVYMAT